MATTDRLLYISSDGLVRQLGFDPTAADLGGAAGVASSTHSATSKTTPVDADELPMVDSADSWSLKKLTWANLKATLKTYFDTLYLGISATAANASQLLGFTWASPGTIGSTTPNSGAFTALSATGNVTLGDATSDTLNVGNGGIIKDASGNVGVGGSPFTSTKFRLTGTHTSSVVSPIQVYSDPTFPATGITQPTNFYSAPSTASNAGVGYTVASMVHYLASQGTIHADSTVTTQYGFQVDVTLTGATTNFGFFSALAASGAARYNFYAAGDAPNRFVGETLVIGPAGLGYGTGSGGTVTQATSKSTAVTLNKPTGQITMNNAALAAGTEVFFSLTNSLITAYDVVVCNLSVSLGGSYIARCSQTYTGGATIGLKNITAGSLSESPVINFAVIKGATS